MEKKNFKNYFLIFLIFLLALFLRVYKLDTTPSGFHQDEITNAYIGRFTLLNGVDLYGNKMPLLYFDKHGDYPPVLPMYFTALGTFIFGPNQFGARVPIALAGSLAVIPVYLLALWTFKDKKTALFAAVALAITPWHVSFSRIGAEAVLATTIYLSGLVFLMSSLNKKNNFFLFLSFGLLILTYFVYPAFRIIVPLTALASFILFKEKKLFLFALVSFVLMILIASTVWGRGRFNQTSMFAAFSGGKNPLAEFIYNEDNTRIARIFNNKIVYFSREAARQYLSYFSPIFLFIEGGRPDWFDVPNTGLFYLSYIILLLPLVVPPLHKKDKNINRKYLLFLITIFFIAPVAAALTTEHTPNVHRSFLMSPMFIFPVACGFYLLINCRFRKYLILIGLGIFVEFIFFYHNYFQHVSMYRSVLRGDGNRQAAIYLQENGGKYDKIYMMATGVFPLYYLYFTDNFDKKLAGTFASNTRIDKLQKINFSDTDCPAKNFFSNLSVAERLPKNSKVLLLVNSSCNFLFKDSFKKIGEIKPSDRGVPVYHIFEHIM